MTRFRIAVLLLILITGICTGTLLYQQQTVKHMEEDAQSIIRHYEDREVEECRQKAAALEQTFKKHESFLACFVSHTDLEAIGESLARLIALPPEDEDFFAQLIQLRHLLEHLRQSEAPVLRNIL